MEKNQDTSQLKMEVKDFRKLVEDMLGIYEVKLNKVEIFVRNSEHNAKNRIVGERSEYGKRKVC